MLKHRITNSKLSAVIAPFGATLVDLRLAGWLQPLVLGFDTIEGYWPADHYAGAVIGRHANRIGGGRASLGELTLDLPRNSGGHHLHGGETGFARQTWAVAHSDEQSVRLSLFSPDGHESYPGNMRVETSYAILDPAVLRIEFNATCDRPTLVNLCHHAYFNLSGAADILDHCVEIAADRYTECGDDLIPTGELRDVAGTAFDLRVPRRVGAARGGMTGFNHNYCLAEQSREEPTFAARLTAEGGPAMELWTTQTGLHFYDGYKLRPGMTGLDQRPYGPNAGLCLEAQNWPDSVNHPHFPSAWLRPGDRYRQITEFRFSHNDSPDGPSPAMGATEADSNLTA